MGNTYIGEDIGNTLGARDYKQPQAVLAYATQACGDRNNPSQSVQEEKAFTVPANPMSDRGQAVCISQDAYDKYTQNDVSSSLKQSGGNLGGGQRVTRDTVGSLCARDYKGVGNQYVNEGKCIVQRIE